MQWNFEMSLFCPVKIFYLRLKYFLILLKLPKMAIYGSVSACGVGNFHRLCVALALNHLIQHSEDVLFVLLVAYCCNTNPIICPQGGVRIDGWLQSLLSNSVVSATLSYRFLRRHIRLKYSLEQEVLMCFFSHLLEKSSLFV